MSDSSVSSVQNVMESSMDSSSYQSEMDGEGRNVQTNARTTKKHRAPRFSSAEVQVLAEQVKRHHSFLFGKLSKTVSSRQRADIWAKMLQGVNAAGMGGRTVISLKKRWDDLVRRGKKKSVQNRRHLHGTGGGPHREQHLSEGERIACSTLVEEHISGCGNADTIALGNLQVSKVCQPSRTHHRKQKHNDNVPVSGTKTVHLQSALPAQQCITNKGHRKKEHCCPPSGKENYPQNKACRLRNTANRSLYPLSPVCSNSIESPASTGGESVEGYETPASPNTENMENTALTTVTHHPREEVDARSGVEIESEPSSNHNSCQSAPSLEEQTLQLHKDEVNVLKTIQKQLLTSSKILHQRAKTQILLLKSYCRDISGVLRQQAQISKQLLHCVETLRNPPQMSPPCPSSSSNGATSSQLGDSMEPSATEALVECVNPAIPKSTYEDSESTINPKGVRNSTVKPQPRRTYNKSDRSENVSTCNGQGCAPNPGGAQYHFNNLHGTAHAKTVGHGKACQCSYT